MTRLLLIALLVLPASLLGLAGCASTADDGRQTLNHPDVPKCRKRAQAIEKQALKEIRQGNQRVDQYKRKEHFNRAMGLLRDARQLNEDELISDPGSDVKSKNLRREITRLSNRIEELHRIMPMPLTHKKKP